MSFFRVHTWNSSGDPISSKDGWWGDEFLIMLYLTDHRGVIRLAERMQKRVCKTGQREYYRLTLSMGISETRKNDTTLDDVLARVDKALYSVKGKGRNKVEKEL